MLFYLQLDWKALLLEVDDSFLTWRKPAALIFGGTPFATYQPDFWPNGSTCLNLLWMSVS